ncbi:hypothetical protein WA588_005456 [Blastocystis sp. NMH]
MNQYGIIDLKGQAVNGIEKGLFIEYGDRKKETWRGFYRNGKRYSEVVKSRRGGRWYEERNVENRELLSIAEYDEGLHDKNGRCMEYENGEWIGEWMYESGVKKRVIREYRNGVISLYDANVRKTFEGRLSKEDAKDGFYGHEPMEGMSGYCKEVDSNGVLMSVSEYEPLRMKKNGKCFELENGRVKRMCLYEMDRLVRVMMEFNGSAMIENDEKGKKVYEGGFKGDMKNGFVREGKGKEYGVVFLTNRNESMTLIGTWKNGKKNGEFFEVDMNGTVKRKCLYANNELNRVIQEFNGTIMIEYGNNGKRIYKGEFAGNVKSGFKRNGEGKEFDVDGETALYSGDWKNGERNGMGTEMNGYKPVYTGEWKNGMRNGKGEEMDESGKVVFMGEWKDGKGKGKEMDANGNAVYEGEWWNGKRNGVGEVLKGTRWIGHWKDGKMNGMGYEKDGNGVMKRGCLFENGEMKRVVQEFNGGKMVEYDENGKKVYEGEYKGSVEKGFVREGKGYCFEGNGSDMKYCVFGGGSLIHVIVEINGSVMTEYDNNGNKKYIGWFKGNQKSGFVRNGKGKEINEKGRVERSGEWVDGEYQEEQIVIPLVNTNSLNYKERSVVIPSSLTSHPLLIRKLKIENNGYNEKVTELKLSGLARLKRIVIGNECFGKVRVFELNGLGELESVVIGERSFTYAKTDDVVLYTTNIRTDGLFRIVNCSKLKSIQIGGYSLADYHSLELRFLSSLQYIVIGERSFRFAPLFSVTDLPQLESIILGDVAFSIVQSIVFENLPKLQSIQLGWFALWGDYRDDRKTISDEPYNYKNTLTMRNLPSLTVFEGDRDNFRNIGSVILENIPQLSSNRILFGDYTFFQYTYSLKSSNAAALESAIRRNRSYL